MKAINQLLILLLLLTNFQSKAQQLLIMYEYNKLGVQAELLKFAPQMADEKTIARYSLYINNGKSVYSYDSIYIDQDLPRTSYSPWVFKQIYKDYNKETWVENSGSLKEGYCLVVDINELKKKYSYYDWEITNEKKSIAGIECIKAITPNGFIAWYAPSIPFPDGPEHGVFNLPGLVLWYETPYHQWKAVLTGIEKRELRDPDCILEKNEDKVRLNEMEIKDLGPDACIRIGKNTPLKKWLKFE